MKTRIISGAVGIVFLILMLAVRYSVFFTVVIGLLSLIAVNEVLHAIKLKSRFVLSASLLYSAVIPYISTYAAGGLFKVITIIYICSILISLVMESQKITFSDIASSFTATLFISFAFSTLIYIRDIYKELPSVFNQNEGFFFLILVLIAAWGSDSGAYFAGRLFGKHKLAPNVSPHKTVEGLVGGVITCVVLTAIEIAIFNKVFEDVSIPYLGIITISIVLSLIGVFGDLTASVIKRNNKIKDFGKIIPGHGGIMDRFDSVIFIAPILYAILPIFQYIK